MSHGEILKEISHLPLDERQALLEASWQNVRAELYRFILSRTHDPTQIEDILEATILHAIHCMKPEHRKHGIKDLKSFLFKVANDRIVDRKLHQEKDRWMDPDRESSELASDQVSQVSTHGLPTLSQRPYGILKFDGGPPNDEEVKGLIADYLIRKYS